MHNTIVEAKYADIVKVLRGFSWMRNAEEVQWTYSARAASRWGSSREAPPPHVFFSDVDLHGTKFNCNPNRDTHNQSKNKWDLITVCDTYQFLWDQSK